MKSLEQHGYLRAAVASPSLRVADVDYNVQAMSECMERADDTGVRLLVFPELSLTAYSCGDLFFQRHLLDAALDGLLRMAELTVYEPLAAVVGLPLEVNGRLYNVAALLAGGDIVGIVPKSHIPNYREYYEQRWFCSADTLEDTHYAMGNMNIPIGTDLLFDFANLKHCRMGIEICEDLWAVEPPSGQLALAGATVIVNPSASNEVLCKSGYRRELVKQQSARCHTAYLYASAGPGESSTDLVYSGHSLLAEDGAILAEQNRFDFDSRITVVDLDLQYLQRERVVHTTFAQEKARDRYRYVRYQILDSDKPNYLPDDQLNRPNPRRPFVPLDTELRNERCAEIFAIQTTALAKRLQHIDSAKLVLGISGGLDSTLALLVACQAFDKLGLDRSGIIAVTIPGMGSSERTQNNAKTIANELKVTLKTIDMVESVRKHFEDIEHDEQVHDLTYENAQARERTQILMSLANKHGGFVLGTGDLSEAALGWCTFNGDHMSMYHINIGVPKTLVSALIEWSADAVFKETAASVLKDILETPISPELLPLSKDGEIAQATEDSIGPYVVHDFILFHTLRHGFGPEKILFLAEKAFVGDYDRSALLDVMDTFYKRFFMQQYKRSAMPDGPKIGSLALSPRGDWRMPSDASSELWQKELSRLRKVKI